MNDRRLRGLEKEISRLIGTAILTEVNSDKIRKYVTVYKVSLTKDARYVDITFSILSYDEKINKEKLLEDLTKLRGFFRKKLSEELTIRYVPEVRVHLDDSVEQGIKISNLIDKVINS
ncbi:30S ribosome-binding factor RbfA [Sneathia sanguinegens]|jgi:hypothetical protein|uniref:Ribosome-binding factor A n=1 Tax=Sneathia sanguinegens TaxID=40543 RepID=A0ABT7HL54_9FUSO|nr:30S ribosome-binding factor RbfA [Sneathia sanguinegens]MDK9580869.1 30S ribosome-binding factor RbfA [Sneathia sanguinegens]MDU7496798.1 30S ribosome-binding factor RbfA [Sneathia sanguinegens]